ncbi:MAG: hypothetical protein R2794_06050 [Chitinophagales bacterium]
MCILFIGCTKDEQTTNIYGIVQDHTTDALIPGATVYLFGHEKGGGLFGGGASFFIDSTYTDTDGTFYFSPEDNDELGYSCMAFKDLYIASQEFTANSPMGTHNYGVTVKMYPIAWLQLHIKSINTYAPSDHISIGLLCNGGFYGETDTTVITGVNGNFDITVSWFLYVGGEQVETGAEEVYCPAFDTTYQEILY